MKTKTKLLLPTLLLSISISTTALAETEVKITASDAASLDNFGFSVSIDGDYAIVPAYTNDDNGSNSGSAYIFNRSGSSWTEQAKITASDAATGDNFGYSVSISGDYAIVGAYRNDDGGTDSGSAYIFNRSGSNWTQQAKITANDAEADDTFGRSVSISGDYAIVGANREDDGGTNSGSAYIFVRNGSNWTQQAKITANDAAANDEFGISVSISGDYAVVGAFADDDGGGDSGSAYIFNRSGSNWTQQAKITANDAAANDLFGYSVSISGDYAIVGAYRNDDGGTDSGSAYIFNRSGSNWTQQTKITADDEAANDEFGISVSISGNDAIVGARRNDDGGTNSGSAYIFNRSGSNWTQQAKITADDAAAGDEFGISVSISGNNAIVGAYQNDDTGFNSGSAYIFTGGDIGLSVELVSFYSETATNGIKLLWETETETNNLGFKIRRTESETDDFKIVASYVFDEKLRGKINSTFPTKYEWLDSEVEDGKRYKYYISDVDLDGKETHHKDRMISQIAELEINSQTVSEFKLAQNHPNPFNPSTTISYQIAKDSKVSLNIYNEKGEFVKELTNGFQHEGSHKAVWDGTDSFGNQVSSGTYFYKLQAGTFTQTNKMILLK